MRCVPNGLRFVILFIILVAILVLFIAAPAPFPLVQSMTNQQKTADAVSAAPEPFLVKDMNTITLSSPSIPISDIASFGDQALISYQGVWSFQKKKISRTPII